MALGGSAVPMSLPEVLPALQQGTIDGVNSVLGVFVAFRYYDAAPQLVDTALWPILSLGLVSKIWFDRLPPDLKKIVLETGSKIEPELAKWQIARIADRHHGLDRQGRQDRQALARATRRRRCAARPPRRRRWSEERSVQGALRQAQGHHDVRELTRDRRPRMSGDRAVEPIQGDIIVAARPPPARAISAPCPGSGRGSPTSVFGRRRRTAGDRRAQRASTSCFATSSARRCPGRKRRCSI